MVIHKNRYLLKLIVWGIYLFAFNIVLIRGIIESLINAHEIIDVIVPVIILALIAFLVIRSYLLALLRRREVYVKNNCIYVHGFLLRKKLRFRPGSKLELIHFEMDNQNTIIFGWIARLIIFRILSINTDCAIVINHTEFLNRTVLKDLSMESATELYTYLQNQLK